MLIQEIKLLKLNVPCNKRVVVPRGMDEASRIQWMRSLINAMKSSANVPNIQVMPQGGKYFVFDGVRRCVAARLAGKTTIRAEVFKGSKINSSGFIPLQAVKIAYIPQERF